MTHNYACIGLHNPKSPVNVGSVMRAAGCYGVNSVFYTGKRYDIAKSFYTDTQRSYETLPLIAVDDLETIIPLGCVPVAIEMTKDARPLPAYKHPPRARVVVHQPGIFHRSAHHTWADAVNLRAKAILR